MRCKVRPRQTDRATDSGSETPSKMRRDFFRPRKARQTPARESTRGRGWTRWRCRQFPSRACLFVDLAPLPSANKEQRLRISESENFPGQRPVGQWMKSHGSENFFDKCVARAFTPKVSVA